MYDTIVCSPNCAAPSKDGRRANAALQAVVFLCPFFRILPLSRLCDNTGKGGTNMNAKILIQNKSILSSHDTDYREALTLSGDPTALSAVEDLYEPLDRSVAKRLPWLIVLLGLGLLVSSVVGVFENVVASLPLIIVFQSLVLDMAGNVGTQSLAVTIRVLMDTAVTRRQKLHLVAKEARVGFFNGLILGVLSFFCIGLYLMLLKGQTPLLSFAVSFCTGVALLVAMLLSSLSGTVIPLVFKKLRIDPAVASGPLITPVNDLFAVVTYYGMAWILLIGMLGLG